MCVFFNTFILFVIPLCSKHEFESELLPRYERYVVYNPNKQIYDFFYNYYNYAYNANLFSNPETFPCFWPDSTTLFK